MRKLQSKVFTVFLLFGILASCGTNQTKSTRENSSLSEIKMSNQEKDLQTVNAFYSKIITNPAALVEEEFYDIISKDLDSISTPPAGEGAEGMFKSAKYFGQVVPDLTWEPQEILQSDNRYTVRSIAKGAPSGPFLGVEPATGKSFEIMSIDILTVENGKVVASYHLEDWMSAVAQLTSS